LPTRISISKSRKEKRAQELVIANTELAFQSIEKKNGTNCLLLIRLILSHVMIYKNLKKIQTFSGRIFVEEYDNLSAMGKYYVERTKLSLAHANAYK
jgi:hypothetical protein